MIDPTGSSQISLAVSLSLSSRSYSRKVEAKMHDISLSSQNYETVTGPGFACIVFSLTGAPNAFSHRLNTGFIIAL